LLLRHDKVSEMMAVLLPTLLLVAVSIALLSVRVILKKGGRFHAEDVGASKAMRDRGIDCFIKQDRDERMRADRREQRNLTKH